ncbi:UNVERIFIED_CONTAM: hypothetical protein FKN15_028819 [Acipenser sinensis]
METSYSTSIASQPADQPPPPECPPANDSGAGKFCCLCGAWFNNPLMAQQHYEGKKHKRNAARARLLEQLAGSLGATETTDSTSIASQPADQPPPPECPPANDSGAGKFCCLCGAWFNNPLMAQQHYEGKKHKRNAARARLLEQLAGSLGATETTDSTSIASQPADQPPPPECPPANDSGAGKFCCLCGAWFNNPLMAQQHYEGKKHKRNAARARLLEQLAGSLGATETTALRSKYSCAMCNVILNSIEQYHAHLQGSKHQNK